MSERQADRVDFSLWLIWFFQCPLTIMQLLAMPHALVTDALLDAQKLAEVLQLLPDDRTFTWHSESSLCDQAGLDYCRLCTVLFGADCYVLLWQTINC